MSLPLIASEYRDLNGTSIQILNGPPSSLEFARIVNIARPVLFKGCFSPSTLPALSKWSDEYLMSSMHNRVISVAVTPDGLADALKLGPQGSICFTEPYTQKMPFKTFFESLCPEAKDPPNEVYYLQSQNGNLSSDDISGCEFPALKEDVPGDISWATQALGNNPEAVNLWIGDSRSITSAHSDPYENIYTLVRGQKHFTLLPPTEGWTLQEKSYPHASYIRQSPSSPLTLKESPEQSSSSISWSSIDPTSGNIVSPLLNVLDQAEIQTAEDVFRRNARPIHVSLVEPGDALYLPACWWHHVRQGPIGDEPRGSRKADEDVTIALNWWYDMEMRGSKWVWYSFLRGRLGGDALRDQEEAD